MLQAECAAPPGVKRTRFMLSRHWCIRRQRAEGQRCLCAGCPNRENCVPEQRCPNLDHEDRSWKAASNPDRLGFGRGDRSGLQGLRDCSSRCREVPGGAEVVRRRHRHFAGHAAANLSFVIDRKWPVRVCPSDRCPASRFGRRLSGDEIDRPTGGRRPTGAGCGFLGERSVYLGT